jgi:membrane protein YdbS with pleckstrin-like domain
MNKVSHDMLFNLQQVSQRAKIKTPTTTQAAIAGVLVLAVAAAFIAFAAAFLNLPESQSLVLLVLVKGIQVFGIVVDRHLTR